MTAGTIDQPESQRKHVTVLFADIAGFTAMSESLDAEDVAETINALWQCLDVIITQHGGRIDKHIGDGLMAIWGADVAQENDPAQAIRAALALQTALATFRIEHYEPIQLRIGITTGLVLLGPVGTLHEFTALGDTVNLASRLEHAAPLGGVLISDATYRHVRGLFDVQALGPLTVKGKLKSIPVYLVERVKPRSFWLPSRGVEGIETRMIGRAADLRLLQDAAQAVLDGGYLQAITILGDAGLGKSRLLYEFRSWIELVPDRIILLLGRASQELIPRPYALLRDIFTSRFAIQESDSMAVAGEKLVQGIVGFLGDEPAAMSQAHLIGHMLGLDFSTSPHLCGILDDPRQLRQRALLALGDVFRAITQHTPILMAVEDLHWADEASLDALSQLADQCASLPILMVYLARPTLLERRPAWGEGQPTHTRLILQPLTNHDIHQLVSHILRQAPTVPAVIRELIVERSAGNPFYIEELIKMLIEQQVIIPTDAQWAIDLQQLSTVEVPPTLIGLLQARLDSLPADERMVLQQAAVIGRIFWDQAVNSLRTDRDQHIQPLLGHIRQRELIYRREISAFADASEYMFKHALFRDVAYERLLKRQRRIYHAQTAAWIIMASGDRVDEYAGVIAEHYAISGMPEDAARWYVRAGEQARLAYANTSAIDAFKRALSVVPAGRQADVLLRLGDVHAIAGQWDDAAACYQTALAESDIDPLLHARLQRAYGRLLQLRGLYPAALEWLGQAHAGFLTLTNRYEESRTLTEIGMVFWRQANYQAATDTLAQSLELARELGDESSTASILHYLGTVAMVQSQLDIADGYYQHSIALTHKLGDKQKLARTINNRGIVASQQGDVIGAQRHYTDALALGSEVGDKGLVASCLTNLGTIAYEQDHLTDAEAYYTQSLMISRELGEAWGIANSMQNLGVIAYHRGDYGEATRLLEAGLAQSREIGAKSLIGWCLLYAGLVALTVRDLATAATRYTESLHLAQDIGDSLQLAVGLIGMAGIHAEAAAQSPTIQVLAAAMTLLTTTRSTMDREYRDLYDRTLAQAQTWLDEASFAALWTAGTALPSERAVALALSTPV